MLTLISGIFASMAHVVTGPDHLAAVTPLAISSRKKSWAIGFSWGIGHVAGMILLGLLFLLFKDILPVESISQHSAFFVGILLIMIGSWAIFRMRTTLRIKDHAHLHFHEEPYIYLHTHPHHHEQLHEHTHVHNTPVRKQCLTALGIGIVHGLAGFSHLIAILPSLAFPSQQETIIYLIGFSGGTIATMILVTIPLGMLTQWFEASKKIKLLSWFTISGGLLAILVGIIWLTRQPF